MVHTGNNNNGDNNGSNSIVHTDIDTYARSFPPIAGLGPQQKVDHSGGSAEEEIKLEGEGERAEMARRVGVSISRVSTIIVC